MNRQQRRQQAKKERQIARVDVEPTFTLKLSDIERMKKEAADEAISKEFVLMLGLPCMSLRDKFGFGKLRMCRFIDAVFSYYDSFNEGNVTLEDCLDCLKEETGTSIIEEAKKRRLF